MIKLIFLGMVGGRFAIVHQVRRAGGIYIEDGSGIYLDLSPDATVDMSQIGWDPGRMEANWFLIAILTITWTWRSWW